MIKYLFGVVLGSFLCGNLSATELPAGDSIPAGSRWEQQLFEKYGTDDTAKAMIHFYYVKRMNRRITTALIFAATAAVGYAYDNASRDPDPTVLNEGAGLQSLFAFLVLLLAIPIALVSFIDTFRFNRKQLIKRLNAYQSGKPVSGWIRNSRIFRKQLHRINNP